MPDYQDPDLWFETRIPLGDFSNRRMTREEWLESLPEVLTEKAPAETPALLKDQ